MGNWMKIGAGIALMLGSGLLASVIGAKGLYSEVTAAWVQAIASVAAIIAAGVFTTAPLRHAESRDRRRQVAMINAVYDASAIVATDLAPLFQAAEARNPIDAVRAYWAKSKTETLALKKLLDEPVSTWPSPQLYSHAAAVLSRAEVIYGLPRGIINNLHQASDGDWELLNNLARDFGQAWDRLQGSVSRHTVENH
jgi:hypothetical protein